MRYAIVVDEKGLRTDPRVPGLRETQPGALIPPGFFVSTFAQALV
jgi:hypothetical protein